MSFTYINFTENQFQDLEYIVGFHVEVHIEKYQGVDMAGTNPTQHPFPLALLQKLLPPSAVLRWLKVQATDRLPMCPKQKPHRNSSKKRESNESDRAEHRLATEQNVVLQNTVRQKDV